MRGWFNGTFFFIDQIRSRPLGLRRLNSPDVLLDGEKMKFFQQSLRSFSGTLLVLGLTACGGGLTGIKDEASKAREDVSGAQADAIIRGLEPTVESVTAEGSFAWAPLLQFEGLRDGPDYLHATIYYPTDAEPPLSSIVIVPGYSSPESTVQAWGPFFASHGIVTMTLGTNSPAQDWPEERAAALHDAIITLRAEHTRTGSPLEGQLDVDRVAVSGWSMGGGGAQIAALEDPTLRAVISLCPWQPQTASGGCNGSVCGADFDHAVPSLIFGGDKDEYAPFSQHGLIHYENTPESTSKLMYEVTNGGHLVANGPNGGVGDNSGQGAVGRFALSWLKVFVEDDERYRQFLLEPPATASRFETTVE